MEKKLPTYELRINPDADAIVSAVALVSEPAIEADFMAFSKVEQVAFATDDMKREVLGPCMCPNQKIYRRDKNGDEYFVYFSEATIRQIAQVFFERGLQKSLNLDHTSKDAHTTIFQSYITDSSKGINAPKGMDLPDGSWIIGAKINDENVWKSIKSGERKGFSVEGVFSFFEKQTPQNEDQEVLDLLARLNTLLDNKSKNK